jgi:acyl-coenzyme A thioesterase PaaI-like protein
LSDPHPVADPLGLSLEWSKEPPGLVSVFRPRPDQHGPPGYLHGGLAATVLDETMASLGWALDGVRCVTATLELKYRNAIPLDGRPLRIEAWREVERPRRSMRVAGHLLLADGTVAVQATGLFVQVRGEP